MIIKVHQFFKTKKQGTNRLYHGHYNEDNYEGKDDWKDQFF